MFLARCVLFFFFKQKTAYELRISDWSSDVCSSDLTLKGVDEAARTHFIDSLTHFGIGFSWGGYESLVVPSDPQSIRTAVAWADPDPLVRLSIGLEDPADLIADLERGFSAI